MLRLLGFVACLTTLGCVSAPPSPNQGPNGTFVELSGTVTTLTLPGASATPYGSKLEVELFNSLTPPNGSQAVLQGNFVDTGSPACTAVACAFGLGGVPLDSATTDGIYSLVFDFPINSATDLSGSVAPAYTPLIDPADVATAKAGNSNIASLVAYMLPTEALATLATQTGLTQTNFNNRGLVIGIASGPRSQVDANNLLPPLQAVSVTATDPNVQVYYPNFSGSNPSSTDSSGIFLLVAAADRSAALSTSLTLKVADGSNTWPAINTTLLPGVFVVQPMAATGP